MRLNAAVTRESPFYVARCLEVDIASQGMTLEEAVANLKEALQLYFEDEQPPDETEPPILVSVELNE